MKRILSFMISIILIGITLLPLTVYAAEPSADMGIKFNVYIADAMTYEPVATFFIPDSVIYSNVNGYGSLDSVEVPYILLKTKSSNSIKYVFDLGYSFSYFNDYANSTNNVSYYVTTNYNVSVTNKINYVRINGETIATSSGTRYYDYYGHTYGTTSLVNVFLSSTNITSDPIIPEEPRVFGYTSINITGEDGNSIKSSIISHEDISTVIGCDDWIGNELEFNDESGQLQLNVTCPTHSRTVVIPTDIYISPLFVLKLVDDSDGSEIDLPTNGKIVLTDYGLEVTPFESSGFTFIVSDEFTQIHGIPINVYNGMGTTLYGSDLVQGTYLNYNIKVDYWQDSYGNVITELVLTIYGRSDVQTFTISVNLADHDITELKGISFSPNKDIPDIKFEYVSDIAIYTGVFYPSSLTDPLNIYVVTPKDAEIIKIEKSEDLNEALQNDVNAAETMIIIYEGEKDGYKDSGASQVDNAGELIVEYMTGDGANVFNDFLSTIYNIPIIVPMMILVLSVATIGYLFYGKQG